MLVYDLLEDYEISEDYTVNNKYFLMYNEILQLIYSLCWLIDFPKDSYKTYNYLIKNTDEIKINIITEFIENYGFIKIMKTIQRCNINWFNKINRYLESETCLKSIYNN